MRQYPVDDMVMTTMTPALDTVFVGLAMGHVMVFHDHTQRMCSFFVQFCLKARAKLRNAWC